MEFKLKTLTPIWTGGVERNNNSILHLTGIKGSLRWWYEVLIRGLNGYACNPTSKNEDEKCKFDTKLFQKTRDIETELKRICLACQMFGCTGWSGKFNLRIENINDKGGKPITIPQIKEDYTFKLRFIEKKTFTDAEKKLINATIKIITDYGAIGGKTVLKPSEKDHKNISAYGGGRHRDYGILARVEDENGKDISGIPSCRIYEGNGKQTIDTYINTFKIKSDTDNDPAWPDLKNFWFVKDAYIKRDTYNDIVKRDSTTPKNYLATATDIHKWLGGDIASSKKIFSFHGIKPNAKIKNNETVSPTDSRRMQGVMRCFGYAEKGKLDKVIKLIEDDCSHFKNKITKWEEIKNEL